MISNKLFIQLNHSFPKKQYKDIPYSIFTDLPQRPMVTSSPDGGENDIYTLTWITKSFSPIIEYNISYRQIYVSIVYQI